MHYPRLSSPAASSTSTSACSSPTSASATEFTSTTDLNTSSPVINSFGSDNTNSIDNGSTNDCANIYEILLKAHNQVQEQCVYGSSTVCLMSLKFYEYGSVLSSCNLGDSGYMLIRDKHVIFKSQSQSHRYNAPFQIGCTPPELLEHDLYRDK